MRFAAGPSRPLSATGGRRGDPLYRIRRRLLAAHDRLSAEAYRHMVVLLEAGDPGGEVAAAYLARELLREVYDTTDLSDARRRLQRFYQHCRAAEVIELTRLARTIRRWEPQILACTPPASPTDRRRR